MYVPAFFHIKMNPHITKAAENYYFVLNHARQILNRDETAEVIEIFKNNSYMIHPESIILNALTDQDLNRRKFAVNFIMKDRKRRLENGQVRQFLVPTEINFKAKSYWDLVNLHSMNPLLVTEPPLCFDISNEDLKACAEGKDITFPKIPNHSQNCERAVATTTQAVAAACGHEKRKELILQTVASRQRISKGATKSDFVNLE